MHPLLARQLKRILGTGSIEPSALPSPWRGFVQAVGQAYEAADADRELNERSIEIASQELMERNRELTQRHSQLRAAEQELRRSHDDLEQRVAERTHELQAAVQQA